MIGPLSFQCENTFLNSASFESLNEFSNFAENMSNIVIWSDFDRVNETHFWSNHRKVLLEQDIDDAIGNRKCPRITSRSEKHQ